MKKISQSKVECAQPKVECERLIIILTLTVTILTLMPDLAMAAADPKDAFAVIHEKMNGWVTGSAGKLITFVSVVMAGVMGVAGFPVKFIIGALGLGLMLASADTIVEMLF